MSQDAVMAEQGTVRAAVVDAALVAAGTFAAHVLVSVALLPGGAGLEVTTLPLLLLDTVERLWAVWLLYLLALGILVVSHRSRTRAARLWLSVPAAMLAWLGGTGLQAVLVFADPGVFLFFGLPTLVQLTAASAATVLVVSRVRRPAVVDAVADAGGSSGPAPYSPAEIVGVSALAAALLVAASFPFQWVRAYLRFFGPAPEPTAEQGAGYLVSFVVAVGLAVVSLVIALRARRWGLVAGSLVALLLVAVLGIVCQVPAGSMWVDPPSPPEHVVDPQWQECAWDASEPGCGG